MAADAKNAGTPRTPVSVALCVGSWLPASETFIYDQLLHQKQTRAWVLARGRTKFASRFPYDDLVVMSRMEELGFLYTGTVPSVTRILSERRPRVIHAHFGLNGAMIRGFAERANIPLVVSFHGHDVGGLQPQNRWTLRYFRYQRLSPALFDYATTLLCASTELAELLVDYGAPSNKVLVHHLGIDTQKFSPVHRESGEHFRILMVGRLVEKKGMAYGIEAFSKIAGKYPQAQLVIVGDGPLRTALFEEAKRRNVSERVSFLGALSNQEVHQQMAQASLMLTPSVTTRSGDRESGVIVLKEAGAMGLPAVATQHGGIPEIIEHDRTGLLVKERDAQGLAMALEALLSDSALREKMGHAARALMVERYDTRLQNARLETHLLNAAERG